MVPSSIGKSTFIEIKELLSLNINISSILLITGLAPY